jgi:hypothetical protein
MSDDEVIELAEDIAKHGLRTKVIIVDAGGEWQILDGRNRIAACEIACVTPDHDIYTGSDPVAFVIAANLRRRHMSASQRAMVAADIAKLISGQTKRGGKVANLPSGPGTKSRDKAAKLLNVSPRTVQTAKKVKEKSAPAIMDAVHAGTLSVDDAASIASLPVDEQNALFEQVQRGDSRTLREAASNAEKPGNVVPLPSSAERALAGIVRELRALEVDQLRSLREQIDELILEREGFTEAK